MAKQVMPQADFDQRLAQLGAAVQVPAAPAPANIEVDENLEFSAGYRRSAVCVCPGSLTLRAELGADGIARVAPITSEQPLANTLYDLLPTTVGVMSGAGVTVKWVEDLWLSMCMPVGLRIVAAKPRPVKIRIVSAVGVTAEHAQAAAALAFCGNGLRRDMRDLARGAAGQA